jgi:hypothetical protein
MELNKEGEIQTLLPGAIAGHSSMRDTGAKEATPVIQQATAQYEYGDVENLVKAVKQYATVYASFSLDRRTAHRRDHQHIVPYFPAHKTHRYFFVRNFIKKK